MKTTSYRGGGLDSNGGDFKAGKFTPANSPEKPARSIVPPLHQTGGAFLDISLCLPEPPSANRYWRHVGGRVLLSREARLYRAEIGRQCLVRRVVPLTGAVSIDFVWHRGRKSGDLDNRLKQLFDALRGHAFADDSQIVQIHAYRAEAPGNAYVQVTITQVEA